MTPSLIIKHDRLCLIVWKRRLALNTSLVQLMTKFFWKTLQKEENNRRFKERLRSVVFNNDC